MKIKQDFQTCSSQSGIHIVAEFDNLSSYPICNLDEIVFNGPGGDGHETMVLEREPKRLFQFCKTAYKPYDLLVTALLLIVWHHSRAWNITSDGNTDGWQPAVELIEKTLGYKPEIPPGIRSPTERAQLN
jgi:hypothetical protein